MFLFAFKANKKPYWDYVYTVQVFDLKTKQKGGQKDSHSHVWFDTSRQKLQIPNAWEEMWTTKKLLFNQLWDLKAGLVFFGFCFTVKIAKQIQKSGLYRHVNMQVWAISFLKQMV